MFDDEIYSECLQVFGKKMFLSELFFKTYWIERMYISPDYVLILYISTLILLVFLTYYIKTYTYNLID